MRRVLLRFVCSLHYSPTFAFNKPIIIPSLLFKRQFYSTPSIETKVKVSKPHVPKPGKSLGDLRSDLAKDWDTAKNGSLTPFRVTVASNVEVWWNCGKHSWKESPSKYSRRAAENRCQLCKVEKNSLKDNHPELFRSIDTELNKDVDVENLTSGSRKKLWWVCDNNPAHKWQATVGKRTLGQRCPHCYSTMIVHESNRLDTLRPELVKEWDKSNEKKPFEVSVFSNEKIWWKCSANNKHPKWLASPNNRSRGSSCPSCYKESKKGISGIKLKLQQALLKLFHTKNVGLYFPIEKHLMDEANELFGTKFLGSFVKPDTWLQIGGKNIVVEHDGYYPHNTPVQIQRDKAKSHMLLKVNTIVIRIRNPKHSSIGLEENPNFLELFEYCKTKQDIDSLVNKIHDFLLSKKEIEKELMQKPSK
eukprot:TRINITY_DN8394_c0_g2_i1.p1 TRINITY_DN8394_c0_g2~~TRINITY_DN8394_c0_g2_i1.p1  ORF type:complete len:418 (-),score=49.94 TRINITY_DN8394_c0_g2_i1:101-1354(-)